MQGFENPLHPTLLRLDPEICSTSALDSALAAHPERGFICTVEESNILAAKRLTARGFLVVRRTVEGRWQGDPAIPMPEFTHGALAAHPDFTKPWLAGHQQHYAFTHRANPPALMDAQNWDGMFLGDDFRPEAAFYILVDGRLAAFSSLRPSAAGWEQAWFGTIPANHPNSALLNAGLVALETNFMAKRGIETVLVEWDSTSPDAAWRMQRYSLKKPRTYLTFTLII